jgi:hypothetical protein
LFKEEKLIVAISGKQHQIYLFPTIVVEGIHAEIVKIDETKSCNLFCLGKLTISGGGGTGNTNQVANSEQQHITSTTLSTISSTSSSTNSSIYTSTSRLLCVSVRKVVSVYEINSTLRPKYKKLRDIELTMNVQSLQIINNQLCIGFQSEFALYSLVQETAPIALLQPDRDKSLQFLIKDPINALMSVQITNEEYLLVFESKFTIFSFSTAKSSYDSLITQF